MKKLLVSLLSILIIYVIYFDITVGTIPHSMRHSISQQTQASQSPKTSLPYFETAVKPGDTIMTIVEHRLNKPLPVSIDKLIADFRRLNSKQTSDKIQIGKTYKFPDYAR